MENEKRLIYADALADKVDESKYNNPHPHGVVRVNHRNEHDHFLRMILDAPTVDAIVLPCKIGDEVYFPTKDYHDSAIIEGISMNAQGTFFNWVQYEVGVDVTECWDDGEFDIDEIGKSVFLTREEAEQALAKMDGDGNG